MKWTGKLRKRLLGDGQLATLIRGPFEVKVAKSKKVGKLEKSGKIE
jgi:hypothetical protein